MRTDTERRSNVPHDIVPKPYPSYRLPDVDLSAIDKEQKRRLAGDLPAVIPSARRAGWPVKLSPRS
jgi:hypothetical protein